MLGVSKDVGSTAVPYVTRGLTLRFVLLTGMAIGLVALSALIQELQGASTAWIVGQSHWSRSQQRASFALERYIASAILRHWPKRDGRWKYRWVIAMPASHWSRTSWTWRARGAVSRRRQLRR
jgi:hypothetical protein